MNKNNAKSLTTLRQKYIKYAKTFEKDIELFKENPDAADTEEEVEPEQSGDSESETEITTTQAPSDLKNQFLKSDDEDDDDDDLFGESSYESSSSDDGAGFSLRDKFLRKKTTGDDDGEKRTQKKAKKIKEKPGKDFRDAESDDEQWETVKRGSSMPMVCNFF